MSFLPETGGPVTPPRSRNGGPVTPLGPPLPSSYAYEQRQVENALTLHNLL